MLWIFLSKTWNKFTAAFERTFAWNKRKKKRIMIKILNLNLIRISTRTAIRIVEFFILLVFISGICSLFVCCKNRFEIQIMYYFDSKFDSRIKFWVELWVEFRINFTAHKEQTFAWNKKEEDKNKNSGQVCFDVVVTLNPSGRVFFCFFSRHYNTKFQICLTKTLTVTDVIADKGK